MSSPTARLSASGSRSWPTCDDHAPDRSPSPRAGTCRTTASDGRGSWSGTRFPCRWHARGSGGATARRGPHDRAEVGRKASVAIGLTTPLAQWIKTGRVRRLGRGCEAARVFRAPAGGPSTPGIAVLLRRMSTRAVGVIEAEQVMAGFVATLVARRGVDRYDSLAHWRRMLLDSVLLLSHGRSPPRGSSSAGRA
jgi:hypothetical protein